MRFHAGWHHYVVYVCSILPIRRPELICLQKVHTPPEKSSRPAQEDTLVHSQTGVLRPVGKIIRSPILANECCVFVARKWTQGHARALPRMLRTRCLPSDHAPETAHNRETPSFKQSPQAWFPSHVVPDRFGSLFRMTACHRGGIRGRENQGGTPSITIAKLNSMRKNS